MPAVFFDLETSDTLFVGQILNYAFIAVDDQFKELARLTGEIKISRLQLPSPGAILANNVNVITHQARAVESEAQAALKIYSFIKETLDRSRSPVQLIGFNSAKFDLPYLRTTLIRNGFTPYFGDKLQLKDLFQLVKKLAISRSDFPRCAHFRKESLASDETQAAPKLSLALENITTRLGLLETAQEHSSEADVLLTIDLAKALRERFDADILTFNPYEPPTGKLSRGDVLTSLDVNYDLSSGDPVLRLPIVLLDENHKYALWIDLKKFEETKSRDSIRFLNKASGYLFVEPQPANIDLAAVNTALVTLGKTNLNNFFVRSTCDIEQDIYRVDNDGRAALFDAIWNGDLNRVKKTDQVDVKTLFIRFQLANYQWGSGDDELYRTRLKKYALNRYGGGMRISKFDSEAGTELNNKTHPTLIELFQALEQAIANGHKVELLTALRQFYLDSDIYKLSEVEVPGYQKR